MDYKDFIEKAIIEYKNKYEKMPTKEELKNFILLETKKQKEIEDIDTMARLVSNRKKKLLVTEGRENLKPVICEKINRTTVTRKNSTLLQKIGTIIIIGGVVAGSMSVLSYNKNPEFLANRELGIHYYVEMTGDGRHIDPRSDHGCFLKKEGTIIERVSNYLKENGISQIEANKLICEFFKKNPKANMNENNGTLLSNEEIAKIVAMETSNVYNENQKSR